jgi:hypothetical protein
MWDNGSWHSNDVIFAPKLGGAISGYLQHLQLSVTINHISRITIFAPFSRLSFPIYLKKLCTPIPMIFFVGFMTWASHSHFIWVKYMVGEPIGRNIVCYASHLCFSPYRNNPPYLCFPIIIRWYTYNRYFFTIVIEVFSIKAFSATIKVCSLVSIGVGSLYITSYWLSNSQLEFSYFGCTNDI